MNEPPPALGSDPEPEFDPGIIFHGPDSFEQHIGEVVAFGPSGLYFLKRAFVGRSWDEVIIPIGQVSSVTIARKFRLGYFLGGLFLLLVGAATFTGMMMYSTGEEYGFIKAVGFSIAFVIFGGHMVYNARHLSLVFQTTEGSKKTWMNRSTGFWDEASRDVAQFCEESGIPCFVK